MKTGLALALAAVLLFCCTIIWSAYTIIEH